VHGLRHPVDYPQKRACRTSGNSFLCSQPRTVATDMPIRRANSACDSPARLRTRRTQAAASLAASATQVRYYAIWAIFRSTIRLRAEREQFVAS
jgi:hypothetical protein